MATAWRRRLVDAADLAIAHLRHALPSLLLLSIPLGLLVVLGSHLANAYPSEQRPFGWPGPAGFDSGVATLRTPILVAASLPALWWGIQSARRLHRLPVRLTGVAAVYAVDGPLIVLSCFFAAAIARAGAGKTAPEAFLAFAVVHAFLALAFYGIGFLTTTLMRRHGASIGIGAWIGSVFLLEGWAKLTLLRTVGYTRLKEGDLPAWFFTTQALNPVGTYRGMLITWRKNFRDWEERAALSSVDLPSWVNPANFGMLLFLLWFLLPLLLSAFVWLWRRQRAHRRVPMPLRRPRGSLVRWRIGARSLNVLALFKARRRSQAGPQPAREEE